jgi:hypothetical protein
MAGQEGVGVGQGLAIFFAPTLPAEVYPEPRGFRKRLQIFGPGFQPADSILAATGLFR